MWCFHPVGGHLTSTDIRGCNPLQIYCGITLEGIVLMQFFAKKLAGKMPNPSLMALQQLRKLVSDLKGQETLESNFAIQPRTWKIENQRGNLVGTCFF